MIDYVARLYLAEPRGKWFVRHLWELPIILLPFLRPLRLLSLAVVVKILEHAVGHTIRGRVIVYTSLRRGVRSSTPPRWRFSRPNAANPQFAHQQFRRRALVGDDDSDHGRVRRPVPRSPTTGRVVAVALMIARHHACSAW